MTFRKPPGFKWVRSPGAEIVVTAAQTAVRIRLLMLDLETSTQLSDLSEGARNVLSALVLCGGTSDFVKPADLRRHPLAAALTHPTYHRAVRSLLERGMITYSAEGNGGRGYALARGVVHDGPAAQVYSA